MKSAEKETGAFYSTVSLNTSLKFPELSDLFSELAAEEELHAREFEMVQKYQTSDEKAFSESPDSVRLVEEFLKSIHLQKEEYLSQADSLTEQQIIAIALKIESHLVEEHRNLFIKVNDPVLKKLFETLNFGNENHVKKLNDFLNLLPGRFPNPIE